MPTDTDLLALIQDRCQSCKLAESTYDTYRRNLHAIVKLVGATSIYEAIADFDKAKLAIEALRTTPSCALCKVTPAVVALNACHPDTPLRTPALQKWRHLQTSLSSARTVAEQDNRMSPEDAHHMIPLEEVAQKAVALTHASYPESRDKLILTIAAYVPAKRAEWGTVRIIKDASWLGKKENGMVVTAKACTLILQDFKTASSFGRYEEDMPATVCQVVRESLKRFPRAYLVQQVRSVQPVCNKRYSELLVDVTRKRLGKDIGVDRLRRMWVCQRVDNNTQTLAQTNEIARMMLHSSHTQRKYKRVPVVTA